jgi:hypothetical protein
VFTLVGNCHLWRCHWENPLEKAGPPTPVHGRCPKSPHPIGLAHDLLSVFCNSTNVDLPGHTASCTIGEIRGLLVWKWKNDRLRREGNRTRRWLLLGLAGNAGYHAQLLHTFQHKLLVLYADHRYKSIYIYIYLCLSPSQSLQQMNVLVG